MVETLPVPNAGSSAFIIQSANPVVPASVAIADSLNGTYYNFNNVAFGGKVETNQTSSNLAGFIASHFLGRFSKYRVTAQSVTAELIAPNLSNQGTITACIQDMSPFTSAYWKTVGTDMTQYPDMWSFPTYGAPENWLLGTSAYTSKADEGCYQPLKLNKFKWQRADDPAYFVHPTIPGNFPQSFPFSRNLNYPYYVDRSTNTSLGEVEVGLKPTSSLGGFIMISGIAANTAIRIRVRQVLEVTGLAGSLYSPMFEAPLPPDDLSIRMYLEISARMKDGYPASYNDLGKLRDIVVKLGKNILPFAEPLLGVASAMPGPVGAIARGAAGAAGLVGSFLKNPTLKAEEKKSPPPPPPAAPPAERKKLNIVRPARK